MQIKSNSKIYTAVTDWSEKSEDIQIQILRKLHVFATRRGIFLRFNYQVFFASFYFISVEILF